MFGSAEACSTFERPERVRANALHAHGGICASDIAKCHGHGNAVTLEHLRIDDAESVALHARGCGPRHESKASGADSFPVSNRVTLQ